MNKIQRWIPDGCVSVIPSHVSFEEHPFSALAHEDPQGALALMERVADGQLSCERRRIDAVVEMARIASSRDLALARQQTMQNRATAYSSIVNTAIAHSTPRSLRRVRITEDRGGFFSSAVFRLTVEID
jgi:hypothetical protein